MGSWEVAQREACGGKGFDSSVNQDLRSETRNAGGTGGPVSFGLIQPGLRSSPYPEKVKLAVLRELVRCDSARSDRETPFYHDGASSRLSRYAPL